MKQTAMQEHINWLKVTLDICKENQPTLVNCISLCIADAESKLAIEKQQMIESYRDGRLDQRSGKLSIYYRMADQYYNETFKK